jgi:hypothetical protein
MLLRVFVVILENKSLAELGCSEIEAQLQNNQEHLEESFPKPTTTR